MRPPMQKTALQQNEANRLQQHQQQQQSVHLISHKHLQQQQQLPVQTTATTTATNVLTANNINDFQHQQQQQPQLQQHNADITIHTTNAAATAAATATRKSKLEQRELLVENHLNNACFAQVHHHPNHQHQQTAAAAAASQQLARRTTPTIATPQSLPSPVYYNDFYQHAPHQQQPQPAQRQQRPTTLLNRRAPNIDDNSSSVKLLDLSTSPPAQPESGPLFRSQATAADVLLHNRQTAYANNSNSNSNTNASFGNSSQQRFSYTSQYSRSSSSDDSSSLSLSTACGSVGGVGGFATATATSGGGGGNNVIVGTRTSSVYNTGSSYSSYNNTFDDAAENFIINFPADTTPTQSSSATAAAAANNAGTSEYYNYCLPLSETEPLLTNIEATVKDKQRSIYLNKNSASLIFTKKDLSQTIAPATPTYQQQQFKLLSRTNNNFNGPVSATALQSPSTNTPPTAASSVRRVPPPPFGHSTLRSFSEENYRRKPTKHLPATYHQQHRRSLQLNYNNNLVTTSTCGAIANNNHCCSAGSGSGSGGSGVGNNICASNNSWASASASSSNCNSAVLHKPHHNNHNYQQQQPPHPQKLHHQQQQQHSGYNNPSSLTNNTAAAARKQYAYSWYAPVYSALEEELEHDSRDSSPIHNLANTKKPNIHQYHHRTHDLNASLTAAATDNEREALLETRNNINIQTQLQPVNPLKRDAIAKQLNPSKLALQHSRNSASKGSLQAAKGISLNGGGDLAAVEGFANYDLEGPHAGSLGLAGGPQPRRIRFGNFLKSLVGLRPSVTQRSAVGESVPTASGLATEGESGHGGGGGGVGQIPSSPEITITRTPSEQNMVVMRDPAGRQDYNVVYSSREKLANSHGDRGILSGGSTSSLNVMQQKLWNIMRREGSAISLHQEKSQSIVHYTGLRKCETVIALTRQTSSPCSPTMTGSGDDAGGGMMCKSQQRLSHGTGSGIFSASGVEQIRPLNRLRNSVSSMNNTCSRCSSLLSLAASSSRFSLNNATANPHPHHQHQHHQTHQQQYQQQLHQQQQQELMTHFSQYQQHQRNPSNVSSSNISSTYSHSRDGSIEAGLHFAVKRNSRNSAATNNTSSSAAAESVSSQRNSSSTTTSSRTPSLTSPTTTTTATTASTLKLSTPPTENTTQPTQPTPLSLAAPTAASLTSPSATGRDDVCFPLETTLSAPLTVTTHLKMLTMKKEMTKLEHHGNNGIVEATINDYDNDDGDAAAATAATIACVLAGDVIDGVSNNNNVASFTSATTSLASAPTNVTPSTSASANAPLLLVAAASAASASTPESIMATVLQCNATAIAGIPDTTLNHTATTSSGVVASRPFEMFTCKLCLIDVDDASNSTVLHQCGCQFCTECMKAYVEFEISEGAYEISCPDAQCPEQGVMTIPEIALLTTNNLMKKHHRYRLNREIELDKTRTWCPRAGCETVCLIGSTISTQTDAAPSTSTSAAAVSTNAATMSPSSGGGSGIGIGGGVVPSNGPLLCAVQCPSCKDEFCSACKKTWHPNITCEEHSRRLAADGQDDIGIPFDNDLIKCCPMCAVPIEKDEGCAQMMCKRCKHVFCWYCLASLDDDFLLRHYDKGPCKNKLGHSRASVVWHRAQVIGIFAGFGILLLVASPLLLLAAPCIICCKCRSCSGSKIDEGDGDMDEATALQSLN